MIERKKDYTISEKFDLPSKGLVYSKPVSPTFEIRSMTTMEEMKRLTPTNTPYKTLCDIIEDCLITPLDIDVYDLCLADYMFMLYKLRIVTYGPEYNVNVLCSHCGARREIEYNLDDLKITEYDPNIDVHPVITLPQSKKEIKLKLQTPKDLDRINSRREEILNGAKNPVDPSMYLTLMSYIDTVDGERMNPMELEMFIKNLPMKDSRKLEKEANKLNGLFGYSNVFDYKCQSCGGDSQIGFRITAEFFRPSND